MLKYLVKRIAVALFTVWVTTVAVSMLIHVVPGDPVRIMYAQSQGTTPQQLEQIRHRLGLDRPLVVQYGMYVNRLVHGDWGTTIRGEQPVLGLLLGRFPNTLLLAASSLLIMAIVGGAVIPLAQGAIADAIGVHHAFLLPLACYAYIVFYGVRGSRAGRARPENEESEP